MEWVKKDNALHKTFVFKNFPAAIAFMQSAVEDIEYMNHHPDWSNIYNRVTCKLCTHDAGNIVTEKDYELAKLLDDKYLSAPKS